MLWKPYTVLLVSTILHAVIILLRAAFIYQTGNKTKEGLSEDDPDEMSELYEEATMSIEDLISRYGKRIKDSVDGSDGNSKGLSLDLISKMCAKGRKHKNRSDATADKVEDNSAEAVEDKLSKEKESQEDNNVKTNSPEKLENQVPEMQKETNGKTQNGSDNHESDHSKTNDAPVSVKGKGVGKGLSNSIRKTVEKTPEEIEIERRETEKNTKRQERKRSLRCKSADELYK